jgi:hypothetical protein
MMAPEESAQVTVRERGAAATPCRWDNSSNRDRPSGPSTTASPSIVKLLALICSAAAGSPPVARSSHMRCGYKTALRGRQGRRSSGNRHA